jgi:adenosine kinase
MSALICGSLAFDNIMVFEDRFENHILPEKIALLNVSFLMPSFRKEYGGCGGNIAYNLQMLGGTPIPMGTVGDDFGPYRAWMEKNSIRDDYIRVIPDTFTAQAYIGTDLADNQITFFHPGAMEHSSECDVAQAEPTEIGIISPDSREGMLQHARQMYLAGIPFIFDPGQGLPMFEGGDLKGFLEMATWVATNEYEAVLMEEKLSMTRREIAKEVEAYIVTKGAAGSEIHIDKEILQIPAVPAPSFCDPTGCGDAYRAGLLYGLERKLEWYVTGRLASLLGSIKSEYVGTQNHCFGTEEIAARFLETYGFEIQL